MLYTLTTNPAVDANVTAGQIAVGSVNRTKDMVFSPNGKGLNVSFALRYFGVQSGIIGFFGGFTGSYITAYCKQKGYPMIAVAIEGNTRVNYFVSSQNGEYKFVDEGPCVSVEKQNRLLARIREERDLHVLSLHGSSAKNQTDDFYDRVLEICREKGVPVVLDITSPKLRSLLKYHPLLMKPNGEELKEIFGLPTENEAEILEALKILHEMGAKNVLLTLGDRGAYFYDGVNI